MFKEHHAGRSLPSMLAVYIKQKIPNGLV